MADDCSYTGPASGEGKALDPATLMRLASEANAALVLAREMGNHRLSAALRALIFEIREQSAQGEETPEPDPDIES